MHPLIGNVSFGIYALMPHGWAFMVAIILLEIAVTSRVLTGVWWKKEMAWPVTAANVASGALGFGASLFLNGGWWLVVWMPWVSPHEVNLETQITVISLYYLGAFVVSVATEAFVEHLMLRRAFGGRKVWLACVSGNAASYLLGGLLLYSWSFGLWQ